MKEKTSEEIAQIIKDTTVIEGVHDRWNIAPDTAPGQSTLHLAGENGLVSVVVTNDALLSLGIKLLECVEGESSIHQKLPVRRDLVLRRKICDSLDLAHRQRAETTKAKSPGVKPDDVGKFRKRTMALMARQQMLNKLGGALCRVQEGTVELEAALVTVFNAYDMTPSEEMFQEVLKVADTLVL